VRPWAIALFSTTLLLTDAPTVPVLDRAFAKTYGLPLEGHVSERVEAEAERNRGAISRHGARGRLGSDLSAKKRLKLTRTLEQLKEVTVSPRHRS